MSVTIYRLACGIKRKVFDQNQVIVITTCDLRASIENPRFGTWEDSILQPSHQGSFCLMHFICFDEKMMWRMAGFEESLVSPAKLDQNEMGDAQNEIGFDVHHVYEHIVVHYLDST